MRLRFVSATAVTGWTACVLVAALSSGCAPKQGNATSPDVTVHTSDTGAEPNPAGRHVALRVHDSTSTNLGGSLVGKQCRVQFRRDALGMASSTGVGPTDDYRGQNTVSGKIANLTDQWLVVEQGGKRFVIPHEAILLIDVQD